MLTSQKEEGSHAAGTRHGENEACEGGEPVWEGTDRQSRHPMEQKARQEVVSHIEIEKVVAWHTHWLGAL